MFLTIYFEIKVKGKHLSFSPKVVDINHFFYFYEKFFSPKFLANFFLQIHKNENFQKIAFSFITFESDDIHE